MKTQQIYHLLIPVLFLQMLAFSAEATTYYFSAQHGIDSRTSLQAQNPDSPWKTLKKLNSLMIDLLPGDSILFKRGDVFEGNIIVGKSGSSINPIVIGAYGEGPNPVISGLTNVVTWTDLGEGIFEASCSRCSSDLNLVLINGTPQFMGRFPNDGYLNYDSHENNTSITDYELSGTPNWSGAEVVIRKNRWVIERSKITSHQGPKISYSSNNTRNYPKDNFGYFFQNDPKTLDQFGEWFFDPLRKKILVFFGDENPYSYSVKISSEDKLLAIEGQNQVVIENISFHGANVNAFEIINSRGISVKNCNIEFSGMDAVSVNWSPYFTIENSSINHSLDNAISIDQGSTSAIIKNNIIKNTGLLPGMGKTESGYQAIMSFGSKTIIEQNVIDSVGYNGIYFGGNLSEVNKNLINNFCLTKDDGGGIYVGDWFPSFGKKITRNIVLNGRGTGQGTDNPNYRAAQGIYIDEPSGSVELTNNTVANCEDNGLFIHNAHNLTINNNTFYNNGIQLNIYQGNTSPSHLIKDIDLNNNIFFSKEVDQPTVSLFSISDNIYRFGNSDNNYFARPLDDSNSIISVHQHAKKTFWNVYNLADWKSASQKDTQSSQSPITIPYYSIKNVIGQNKIPNGDFTSHAWNAYAWSEDNNSLIHWDNTDRIEGGSLKISYSTPSTTSNLVHVGITDIGVLDSTKNYLLKFDAASHSSELNIGIFLQQTTAPFSKLTPIKYTTLRYDQISNEILFSHPITESNANLIFQLNDVDGPIWLDNIELHEVNVDITNPDDHIRFEYNATNSTKTIILDKPYVDVKNNMHRSTINLQPWTSTILISKDNILDKSSQSITFPTVENKKLGDLPFELEANSSSGLPIEYEILSGPAVIAENKVTITGTGTVAIQASQSGNLEYRPATPVIQTFKSTKANKFKDQELLRINSGGPSFSYGKEEWIADKYYNGGNIYNAPPRIIKNTDNVVLYHSERFGNFSYSLPVSENGFYKVELHFSEIYWNQSDMRIFDLEIEKSQYVWENIDLYKKQGGSNTAGVFIAENIEVTDGFLDITLTSRKDNAKISGIVLYKQASHSDFKLSQSPPIISSNIEDPSINQNKAENKLRLYPNPTRNRAFLDLDLNEAGEWNFALTTPKGTSIPLGKKMLKRGKHTIEFDFSVNRLSAGTYFLRLTNNIYNSKVISLVIY